MIKYFLLLMCIGTFFQAGYSQAVPEKFIPKKTPPKEVPKPVSKPVAKTVPKTVPKNVAKTTKSPQRSKEETPKPQSVKVDQKLETIFAASEDCLIEIDGKWFGTLNKDEPKMIPLDFGQHKLLAQSKNTKELYNTTITILGNNQVVNITMSGLGPAVESLEDSLTFSAVANVQPTINEAIKVDKVDITEPVPTYVSRNTILSTISELSANMVSLAGGKYKKDDPKTSSGKKSKDSVLVSPFSLGKYEVTQQQWQQVMGYNNSENKNCSDCPVENVSWYEIDDFIRILNETSDSKFRLPTNAEWDYAVRLDIREYIDKRGGPKYGDNVAWNENNAQRRTHSVGTRIPHRSGAYDLMGNVAEWCADWYDLDYLKSNKNMENPKGPPMATLKIVRGGTYANKDFVELNSRDPKEKQKFIGFRLVQYE
jgi:hypothetical protein